ncbi:erythromycin esterase family protein [Massilia sp. CCM 9210]|uniref:erythromycin esterase family protein n=1 Tax=Massilia scottii TaxID=3057166 RepID=UPI0027963EE2|nr:erythromycin esterase family protein [Massilia sp. CCM 9210]MDQ1811977.1 erythromycin esterase family protein [Massilia sp. CCM 9210]
MSHLYRLAPIAALLLTVAAGPAYAQAPTSPAKTPLPALQWPIADVDPDNDDFSDLKPFADAIGNARIVALGEQTHGAREEYLLKTRLLKFLHQRMGFDVLLLESGFYDIGRLAERAERGEKLDASAPGNVFFMYAKSAEGRGMLQYLDRQRSLGKPMQLGGIDSQHTGELSQRELIGDLQSYLRKQQPGLAEGAGWTAYAKIANALFAMKREAPQTSERETFLRHANLLESNLCQQDDAAFKGRTWWCKVVRSIHAQATSYWSGDRDYQRDNQMGANAIWLADHLFAGKKVVIWGHTVHVARGFQRSPTNLQAGEVMHRHWGRDYKVAQFSTAGGTIFEYVSGKPAAVPTPAAQSLEQRLAQESKTLIGLTPLAPVDLTQFSYEYLTGAAGRLGTHWDVLFFIPAVTPVTMTR